MLFYIQQTITPESLLSRKFVTKTNSISDAVTLVTHLEDGADDILVLLITGN
jgi:hypothetical protein